MLKHKKNNRQDKDMKYIVYKTYVIGLYGIHVKFREKNDCVLYLCTLGPCAKQELFYPVHLKERECSWILKGEFTRKRFALKKRESNF